MQPASCNRRRITLPAIEFTIVKNLMNGHLESTKDGLHQSLHFKSMTPRGCHVFNHRITATHCTRNHRIGAVRYLGPWGEGMVHCPLGKCSKDCCTAGSKLDYETNTTCSHTAVVIVLTPTIMFSYGWQDCWDTQFSNLAITPS